MACPRWARGATRVWPSKVLYLARRAIESSSVQTMWPGQSGLPARVSQMKQVPPGIRLIHIQQVDPHPDLAQLPEHLPCTIVDRALQVSLDVADDAAIQLGYQPQVVL